MRSFLRLTGILLAVTALGLGLWWAWPLLAPPAAEGWLATLARVDAALLQDRPAEARRWLEPGPRPQGSEPVSSEIWLRWLKRSVAVAERTGDWAWAATVADQARTAYPGNADLAAVDLWCRLQAGQVDRALDLAPQLAEHPRWAPLVTQARVEATGQASPDWAALAARLATPSAEAHGAYQALVPLVNDPGFRTNALLAALGQGELDAARDLLDGLSPQDRDRPPFDRLQGLMAYDQGDWSRAAALLRAVPRDQPQTLAILAEVYLHLQDRRRAEVIYDQLLADAAAGASVPRSVWLDRLRLALEDRDAVLALDLLRRAEGRSPDRSALGLARLEARFLAGETTSVLAELDRLAELEPLTTGEEARTAVAAVLLRHRLVPHEVSVPALWSLFHRHQTHGPVAERLVWALLEQADPPAALKALDLHERAVGETPWWTPWYRGLALALDGRYAEAEASLAQVPAPRRDAGFWASWALLPAAQVRSVPEEDRRALLASAVDRLTQALDLLPPDASLARRSLWLTRRGELRTALLAWEAGEARDQLRAAATEDLRRAVDLDETNLRAPFLLRQLPTKESS